MVCDECDEFKNVSLCRLYQRSVIFYLLSRHTHVLLSLVELNRGSVYHGLGLATCNVRMKLASVTYVYVMDDIMLPVILVQLSSYSDENHHSSAGQYIPSIHTQ